MDAQKSPADLELAAVFAALPVPTAVFAADPPRFTVLAANDAFLAMARRPRDAVVGLPLTEAFRNARPEGAQGSGASDLRASLTAAVQTGAPQRMARQRYDLARSDGAWEARYWDTVNIPVPGPDGAVRCVLHQTADVTAQVHEEATAARAERRAERILERMGDAHCVLDREFRIESVNAAAERVLGVPRAALVGRSHWEVFPASVDAPVGRAYRRVVAEGVEQHLTHHYTGEGYDLHLEIEAYPTEEGGVALFWRDVSERVRADAALRANEEKYRALFNGMDEAYAVVEVMADADGRWTNFRFLEVNPAFMRHTGMPYPVGRTALELLGTPNRRWAELYGRAVDTGESIRVEEAELTLGRVFELDIFRLGGEGSRRVAVVFTDISERKRAGEALRQSEERLRLAIEATGLGVSDWDLETDQVVASARFREIFGLPSQGEILGAALLGHVVHPDDRAWVSAEIEQAMSPAASGRFEIEHRALTPAGERWILTLGQAHFAGDGSTRRAVRILGNHLDITVRKRAEDEVRRSEQRQRFLVRLEDVLRPLAAPAAIQDAAARVLGEQLAVSRALYAEVDGEPGAEMGTIRGRYVADPTLPSFPEQYAYAMFGVRVMPLRRGRETIVVDDVTTDPRFEAAERAAWTARGVRAAIIVPLMKSGRFVAEFGVQSAAPRRWTADEVTLVEDTAERTWAASERGRVEAALRANEERLRGALSIPTVGVLFFRLDGTILDANAALERMLGYTLEELRGVESWSALTPPEFAEVTARAGGELATRGRTAPYEKQWVRKDGSRMWCMFAPTRLAGSGHRSECVEFVIDITRTKEAEAARRESEERLAKELDAARRLQQVSTELISEAEPGTFYTKLVDAAIALMHADAGSLHRLDPDGGLRLLASRDLAPQSELHWQWVGIDSADICALALNCRRRIIVPDVEVSEITSGARDLDQLRRSRLRAVQSTPLVARDGRPVGMLSTHWRHTQEPSANELALLDVLAREAADLLDRMQAQTALRERAEWLKGQGDALIAAVNGADLQTSLAPLVRTATETLGAGVRAAFYLLGDGAATLQHVVGMSAEYASTIDAFKFGPEFLACGLAAHRGGPFLSSDVQTDPRWEAWRGVAERFEYRGCWSFPIHSAAGTLVGTLALYWPRPREASARELELASFLTNTAAIIISRHHESEVRRKAEEALRALLAEREALLRELHHRVKNNLQVITSLLEMQARHVSDPRALPVLLEARNRVSAIGAIHELLYQSGSLSRVDLVSYAKRLLPHVVSLYERTGTIAVAVLGDEVTVDLARAVPLGLLLNELISNVCKHAFPMHAAGALTVALKEDDSGMHLRVTDDGRGLPAGFSARGSKTLGLQLVRMLAKQLGGTIAFHSERGTSVDVHLPR